MVSPAHAGMDPADEASHLAGRRFPRPRGDGPYANERGDWATAVSPPTRGWTVKIGPVGAECSGFPAHAGMDPLGGPGYRHSAEEVSPPTRGWTIRGVQVLNAHRGFPAHAGMDLISLFCDPWYLWFPRPRGDGP